MPKHIKLKHSEIPRDFLSGLTRGFFDYGVAMYTHEEEYLDIDTVRPIGSGTLIRWQDSYGILTAHHVVHQNQPPVRFGPNENGFLSITASKREHFKIPRKYLIELPIGIPKDESSGPDLTVIKIPMGDSLNTYKARKSFWPIDQDVNKLEDQLEPGYTQLCTFGAPKANQKLEKITTGFRVTTRLIGYYGGYEKENVFKRKMFDYIDTPVKYTSTNNLPESFGGVSGGGLWAFNVSTPDDGKTLVHSPPFLCGVAFYETAKELDRRDIRHHFIRSIYEIVRNRLCIQTLIDEKKKGLFLRAL